MTLLLIDGFDHYNTKTTVGTAFTDTLRKKHTDGLYANVTQDFAHTGSIGRSQSCYIGAEVANPTLTAILGFSKALGAYPSPRDGYVVGYWCYLTALDPLQPSAGVSFRTSGHACGAGIMADGSVNIFRTAFGSVYNPVSHPEWTLASSSPGDVPTDEWFHIEVKISYLDAGNITVRVNGSEIVSFDADYTNASSDLSAIWVPGGYAYIDDYYLLDTKGDTNNDFLGPCRVHTLYPTRTGFHADPTTFGSYLLWENVAWDFRRTPKLPPLHAFPYLTPLDIPLSDQYNGPGSIEFRTPPQTISLGYMVYPFTPTTIFGVQLSAARTSIFAFTVEAYGVVRQGGTTTTYPRMYQPPGDSQVTYNLAMFDTQPDGSLWTADDINASEFGFVVSNFVQNNAGYVLRYVHCPIEVLSDSDEPMLTVAHDRSWRVS